MVTPGGALGDDAAPPDVRLVPGDAEEEEYEEPDPPLRPSACTGIGRLAASPLLGVARIAAAPFRILGRRRESLEIEAAQLRERRKELAAARDAVVTARRLVPSRARSIAHRSSSSSSPRLQSLDATRVPRRARRLIRAARETEQVDAGARDVRSVGGPA